MKNRKILLALVVVGVIIGLYLDKSGHTDIQKAAPLTQTSLIVLGTVQDAGSPHAGCNKNCCKKLFFKPDKNRMVVSLGLVDPSRNKSYLFEATPDLPQQMKLLTRYSKSNSETPSGIFLTHAHIGHYTGSMFLGKESMNANGVTVYAMPKMKSFLEQNGPWSQLVTNSNIAISALTNNTSLSLNKNLKVIPFAVPHRDEYSETVGYKIIGANKTALFLPDIDKWTKWSTSIVNEISQVDYALIDATFYDGDELSNRDISQVPHPFVIESMELFKELSDEDKAKVYFIHFNHSNPLLNHKSNQYKMAIGSGFNIAQVGQVLAL